MCVDCRRGRARGKGLTDSQSQCPWPLPLPCRPHSRLTDPVGEGREPLSSGSLLRPQRTTPHPDHPARFLGFSFPKSRMELTASEGSLKDAGGDQWTEPTTPASPGDSAAASMRPGGSRKEEAGSWGVQATTPPASPAHVGSPTAPGSADSLAGATEAPAAQSPGDRAPDTHWHPGLFAQQRVCQTHVPQFQPFSNQIYLISHLYFGRGKNVISNLKFKKPSPSSKCTQLRWCLGN